MCGTCVLSFVGEETSGRTGAALGGVYMRGVHGAKGYGKLLAAGRIMWMVRRGVVSKTGGDCAARM